jgi:hypothetical protein
MSRKYLEANLEKVRAQNRKSQATKRARFKEGNDFDTQAAGAETAR